MATDEKRREVRIKVRFPCELAFGRQRASGTVLDLSAGGLSVVTDRSAEQGDSVSVRLEPKGRSSVDIKALVWHIRTFKNHGTGKASTRLGLVLSEAPDEFLELLKSKAPPPVARPARPVAPPQPAEPRSPEPEPASEPEPVPEPEPATEPLNEPAAEERRFRARVKQSATTRTRVILVFAESVEDAEEKALAEAGADWSLLEVSPR